MEKKYLEKTQDILVLILNHLLFVGGILTILDLFQVQNTNLFLWIGMIFLPIFLYSKRVIGTPKLIPIPCMIIGFAVLSMLEKQQTVNDWSMYYFVFVSIYLIGYFIFLFIKRYREFISLNENSAGNKAEQEIFQNGMRQTLFYCAGSFLIFSIVGTWDWLVKIFNGIGDALVVLLRQMFAGLKVTIREEVPQNVMQNMTSESNGTVGQATQMELSDTFLKTMIVIFSIAAVIAFFVLTYLIWKYYRVHFKLHKKNKNENELQMTGDIREKCEVTQKKKKKRDSWFAFLSYRERVRKMYRKKILASKEVLVGDCENQRLEYLTAKECCEQLGENELRVMYEKARYSEED